MTINFLFFLILIYSCHSSSLPAHLKCADKACQENVSIGRILQSTYLLFGDQKELKKSTKVNIKGKNVDINNSLWLVESDGLKGFVDFSLIKENSNSIVHDLEISDNPYYKPLNQGIIDGSEGVNDDSNSKLFSKQGVIQGNTYPDINKNTVNVNEGHDTIHQVASKNTENLNNNNVQSNEAMDNIKEVRNELESQTNDLDERPILNNVSSTMVNNISSNDMKDKNEDVNNEVESQDTEVGSKTSSDNILFTKELQKNNSNPKELLDNVNIKKELTNNLSPSKILKDKPNFKDGQINKEIEESVTAKNDKDLLPTEIHNDISDFKGKNNNINHENETEKSESLNNILTPIKLDVDISNNKEEPGKIESQENETETKESIKISNVNEEHEEIESQENETEKKEAVNNISLPFDTDISNVKNELIKTESQQNEKESVNNILSPMEKDTSNTEEPKKMKIENEVNDNKIFNERNEANKESSSEKLDKNIKDIVNTMEGMQGAYEKTESLNNVSSTKVNLQETIITNKQKKTKGFVEDTPILDVPRSTEKSNDQLIEEQSKDKNQNIASDSVERPTEYKEDNEIPEINKQEIKYDKTETPNYPSLNGGQKKDLINAKEESNKSGNSILNLDSINSNNTGGINTDYSNETSKTEESPPSNSLREELNVDKPVDVSMKVDDKTENIGVDNYGSKDSDPWLSVSTESTLDSIESKNLRSPILIIILKIEKCLQSTVQLLINRTGLRSSIYITKFVHNWLGLSLENFVLILLLLSTLVIVVYTPKMFRLNRDWKYEFEKQRQLIVELESKLKTTEEVRQKLTIQNYTFEKVVEEYRSRVTEIQDDSNMKKKTIFADLEKMKKANEHNIKKLSQELDIKMKQFQMLEKDVLVKETIINELNETMKEKEYKFNEELLKKHDCIDSLRNQLSEVEDLKELLKTISTENTNLKEDIINLSVSLRDRNDEFNKLNSTFESLKLFEGLEEEDCRDKVQRCLEYNTVRLQLDEVEVEADRLRKGLTEANAKIGDLEAKNDEWGNLVKQYKEQQGEAAKEREAAETKLQVLTDYFHKKEIEMQRSLGQESIEKSLCQERAESLRAKIENLESENGSLLKTVERLKTEVRQCQSFSAECKAEASNQVAQALTSISHLERELAREREESRQLRQRLSYYVGPLPASNNHSRDRPVSRQSVPTSDHVTSNVPPPPIFPLSLLPQGPVQRSPFSGRNSVNSLSKRSNHS